MTCGVSTEGSCFSGAAHTRLRHCFQNYNNMWVWLVPIKWPMLFPSKVYYPKLARVGRSRPSRSNARRSVKWHLCMAIRQNVPKALKWFIFPDLTFHFLEVNLKIWLRVCTHTPTHSGLAKRIVIKTLSGEGENKIN